ncbi:MAG: aldo/keto reductase [Desulfobacterales bacterium]|nr:MAG: aldo/keto reductase [Desulfobacterales bacterium]UCD89179.1 MAG: aldo/keto reductase [Desulfobacterales bacterium]
MNRMILGKTGIEITRFGFGGIPIQRVEEKQAVETVRHAVAKGVDFIDTSRAYTTSERRIGLALKKTNQRVVLASKSRARTSDAVQKDLATSLKELQKDYIDIYQCHFVQNDDDYQQVISPGGALEGLIQAKKSGLIGHIGITSHNLHLMDRILDDGHFETIMVCFSFLEPKARETIIPKAIENNVGVIAMKSFSGGIIDHPELAIKYALSYPDIAIIPGVESKDLFDQNWNVFLGTHELSDKEKQEIEKIIKQYDKNFCRRCDYCQPCSEDIPIQLILGLRWALKRFGKGFAEEEWPRKSIAKARSCSECGECLDRCPYQLPVPDLIKENIQWLDDNLTKP